MVTLGGTVGHGLGLDLDVLDHAAQAVVLDHVGIVGGLVILDAIARGHFLDVAATAAGLVIDRQVRQRSDHQRAVRQVRHLGHLQAAHTALAQDQIGGDLLAGRLVLVDHREILVVHQVAAQHDHQTRILAVPRVEQVTHHIEHQRIEVAVVGASCTADDHLAGGLAARQHALGRVGAVLLQPADIDVFQQRERGAVGIGSGVRAVEADLQTVQRLALDDRIAQACLEVRELGPGIEQRIRDGGVEVGLLGEVLVLVERGDIARGARLAGAGVGAAGDAAGDADAHLLAGQLVHRDDVDLGQELAGFLHARFQLLLHGRFDGERVENGGDAVELGDLLGELVELQAGGVLHGGSEGGALAACVVCGISSRSARPRRRR
ncbi:hypothetical protein XOO1711 [Xanthomonas oryzae pv. oryzae KACC 10331]|uniref:Uncharacterized protein n=1 Tax=Xanthomonas oryzae pv. oryzae (strain KACC10331 / KXO85) TaxID=291331 RepID=Q5H256_XANOR|nr:hypothetical protein XOO1711 [Xanthomonas oryzae pv. oryzae KACC 10331]